jgi:hypothetical protein
VTFNNIPIAGHNNPSSVRVIFIRDKVCIFLLSPQRIATALIYTTLFDTAFTVTYFFLHLLHQRYTFKNYTMGGLHTFFSIDEVYNNKESKPIIILFVNYLTKQFKG